MLAHRVVLRRGLEIEPEQWLATVDEKTYRNWESYYRLEPWGDEQYLLARLINLISLLVASKAGERAEDYVIQLEDIMPPSWAWRPQKRTEDIAAVEQKLAGLYSQ
jgi:hypothetical protein